MATVEQLVDEEATGESTSLEYIVYDASTSTAARNAMLASAPTTFNGLARRDKDARVRRIPSRNDWTGTVEYSAGGDSSNPDKPIGYVNISVRCAGQTIKVFEALSTTSYFAAGEPQYDFGFSIGVDASGEVQGVDKQASTLEYSITQVVAASSVTDAYIESMYAAKDKVNSNAFTPFAIGEGLLRDFSATPRPQDQAYELNFVLAHSKNATNLDVGNGITVATKAGWQYLDVFYKTKEQDVGGTKYIASVPVMARVHDVYEQTDFSVFNLPTIGGGE